MAFTQEALHPNWYWFWESDEDGTFTEKHDLLKIGIFLMASHIEKILPAQ
jgi:hypothetical protein